MSEPGSDHPAIDVSVIIVTYNNEQEIEPCLHSLAKQQGSLRCEIIIIDNASSDLTCERIKECSSVLDHIHIIYNTTNQGFTKAINQGMACVNGTYIVLLNPDMLLPATSLTELVSKLGADPQLGIIAPQFVNSDQQTIQPSCRRFPRRRDVWYHALGLPWLFPTNREFNGWKMGDFDHRSERYVDQPQGAFLLTSQTACQKIGPLDEQFPMFFSDVDWCRRYIDNGWKIRFTPGVHVVHHQGRSVVQRRLPLIWSSHRSFYRYFRKYDKSFGAQIVTFLTGALLFVMAALRTVMYLILPPKRTSQ